MSKENTESTTHSTVVPSEGRRQSFRDKYFPPATNGARGFSTDADNAMYNALRDKVLEDERRKKEEEAADKELERQASNASENLPMSPTELKGKFRRGLGKLFGRQEHVELGSAEVSRRDAKHAGNNQDVIF